MAIAIFSITGVFASPQLRKIGKTADEVFAFAKSMTEFDATAFQNQVSELTFIEKTKLINLAIADVKACEQTQEASVGEYILAILLPPLAVGIHTDWAGKPTISNVLWTCLGYAPGIVHAFIVLGRE
jgi:uncharacterized membrane protein YqaE (UPF0057 family)